MRFFLLLFRFWLLLAFILMTGVIAIYNQEIVPLSLPPVIQHISLPAFQVYSGFLMLGATLTVIFFGLDSMKKSLQIRKLQKQIKDLEETSKPELTVSTSSDLTPLKDSELNPV